MDGYFKKEEEEKEQVKEAFDCNCAIVGLVLQFGSMGDKDNTKNGVQGNIKAIPNWQDV